MQLLAQPHCVCGEGPLFDPTRNCIFWTDIDTGRMFRLDCDTNTHRQVYQGDPVGGFTLQTNGDLLLFRVKDIALLKPDIRAVSIVLPFADEGCPRFNDTSAGPDGTCYAGTMGKTKTSGGLFHLSHNRSLKLLFRNTGCANGMGWTPDQRTMYWTCSTRNKIFAYDYNPTTGEMSNERTFHDANNQNAGTCDGLTVDSAGQVYSARWGGSAIYIFHPDGSPASKIEVPTPKVTSLCFGGKDLKTIYITTAGASADGPHTDPHAGALFSHPSPTPGQPEYRSQIQV